MLVLQRKVNDRSGLLIGDNITIFFKDYHRGYMKVLIDAPRDIKIDRITKEPEGNVQDGGKKYSIRKELQEES